MTLDPCSVEGGCGCPRPGELFSVPLAVAIVLTLAVWGFAPDVEYPVQVVVALGIIGRALWDERRRNR